MVSVDVGVVAMNGGNNMGLILLPLFFVLYIMPASLAHKKNHKDFIPILILNVFLGWTLVGWVIALMWVYKYSPESDIEQARRKI